MHITQISATTGSNGEQFKNQVGINLQSLQDQSSSSDTSPITEPSSTTMSSFISMDNSSSDPFDMGTQPVMFMSDNRTPVITDIGLVVVVIMFITCLLLLLVLLPSIRVNKWRNFLCLLLVITIGASVPFSLMSNTWMVGRVELDSVPYDSSFRDKFSGLLKVEIGLSSMNISLIGTVIRESSRESIYGEQPTEIAQQVLYNERFYFEKPDEMQIEHLNALRRGLPYPILSVTEFFSNDSDGFNWTRQIRRAAFYTCSFLYITFIFWLITLCIMSVIPAYFLSMLRITCILSAISYLNYLVSSIIMSPSIISVYNHWLIFTANNTILLSAISSILAYYCAKYIDMRFKSEDPNEPLTIIDSESYLRDRKILDSNQKEILAYRPKMFRIAGVKTNSVVIPIGDIEEKFAKTST